MESGFRNAGVFQSRQNHNASSVTKPRLRISITSELDTDAGLEKKQPSDKFCLCLVTVTEMFTCKNCNKTFTSRFCARLHERSHAGDESSASNSVGKYRCRHKGCKRTFEKLSRFVAHRSHHNSSLKYSSFGSMRTKIRKSMKKQVSLV